MPAKPQADIAIIGGSGLYQMEGFKDIHEVRLRTPFGPPSDAIIVGKLEGRRVAFLSRHGRGHRIPPTSINYRANIHALKALGVTRIFSVSAVGSMKEIIKPGDLVLPDQFIDRTTQRVRTFFEQGVVAHVAFSDPICSSLSSLIWQASQGVGVTVHRTGTYLCIEGPQFSTRAESRVYRTWGVEVIGMTNLPEAKLAREAELCYATLALVTDYDCWHDTEEDVSVTGILAIMKKNVEIAQKVLLRVILLTQGSAPCSCHSVLDQALLTDPNTISPTFRKRYHLLLKRMWEKEQTKKR